jgi:hypothetical protein
MNTNSYKVENCCKDKIIEILNNPKLPDAVWNKTENIIYVNSKKINRGLSQKETFNHDEKGGIIDIINCFCEAQEEGFENENRPTVVKL